MLLNNPHLYFSGEQPLQYFCIFQFPTLFYKEVLEWYKKCFNADIISKFPQLPLINLNITQVYYES